MKLSKLIGATLAAVALSLTFSTAHAAIVGVTGQGLHIAAPASAQDDAPGVESNQAMLGFDEKQGVLLTSDLSVDGGVIAAGTRVDSHMILLNSIRNFNLTAVANWMFSGTVLGVMSDIGGSLEAASNSLLGGAGTIYPGAFNNRGLENRDPADFYGALGGTSLNVGMHVTEPGDWIRVVTLSNQDVPAPGALGLIGLGLLGLISVARRKRVRG